MLAVTQGLCELSGAAGHLDDLGGLCASFEWSGSGSRVAGSLREVAVTVPSKAVEARSLFELGATLRLGECLNDVPG